MKIPAGIFIPTMVLNNPPDGPYFLSPPVSSVNGDSGEILIVGGRSTIWTDGGTSYTMGLLQVSEEYCVQCV
jgi:hypothetical protein